MYRKFAIFLASVILFTLAVRADDIVDEIVARVNDGIITRSDYEKAQQSTLEELKRDSPSDWQSKWPNQQKDILRELIDNQLLLDKGKDLGISGETEVIKRLDQIRQQMHLDTMEDLEKAARQQGVSFTEFKDQIRTNVITQQVMGREVGSHIQVTSEEIKKWYDEHQKELDGPEAVSLSEILVSTQPKETKAQESAEQKKEESESGQQIAADEEKPEDPKLVAAAQTKAQQIFEQLKKGSSFEDMAKRFSDGTTAAQGGVLGDFKRGELSKELEDKTFGLKIGDYTNVIRTKQGFIILKVTGHRPAGIPPLANVEDKIRDFIFQQKFPAAARAYLTKLREQAYIDIKPGYVDTGASPNQSKPVIVASADQDSKDGKQKKKKHFLIF